MLLLTLLLLRLSGVALDLTGVMAAVFEGVARDDGIEVFFVSAGAVMKGLSKTG